MKQHFVFRPKKKAFIMLRRVHLQLCLGTIGVGAVVSAPLTYGYWKRHRNNNNNHCFLKVSAQETAYPDGNPRSNQKEDEVNLTVHEKEWTDMEAIRQAKALVQMRTVAITTNECDIARSVLGRFEYGDARDRCVGGPPCDTFSGDYQKCQVTASGRAAAIMKTRFPWISIVRNIRPREWQL